MVGLFKSGLLGFTPYYMVGVYMSGFLGFTISEAEMLCEFSASSVTIVSMQK